jgi:CRISPR-associated protein Csd2
MAAEAIKNRYEFVLLYDVENGNPNGDPDAGNMPRIDPETGYGLVTDVCLKRKIRNYVEMVKGDEPGYRIYIKEGIPLNSNHKEAYLAVGLQPGTKASVHDVNKARAWMCKNFFDIRTFGAVLTVGDNCGQVRGPVQINFSRSIDPIVQQEVTITRLTVTREEEAEKERTIGRKHIVPYALYRAEGYVSARLANDPAKGTGFSEDDLNLLWEALINMFEPRWQRAGYSCSDTRVIWAMLPRISCSSLFKSGANLMPIHHAALTTMKWWLTINCQRV